MSADPPEPPSEGPRRVPFAPVLGSAERFRTEEPQTSSDSREAKAVDEERLAAVGGFLGDLAHALAARGGAEVEALLERSEHERRRALRDRPELRTLEAAAQLLARCRAAWPDDPAAAVEAARLTLRLLSDPPEPDLAPAERLPLLASAREHLAAAERIARRAAEIEHRQGRLGRTAAPEFPSEAEDPAVYPQTPAPVLEVAEDALSVEIEAALDDLRDLSLGRGRANDAALAVLDRARFALDRGGPEALADLARGEVERFAPRLPPVPREALRQLCSAAEERSVGPDLLDRLRRILLAAGIGFSR